MDDPTENIGFDLSPSAFERLGHQLVQLMGEAVLAEQTGPVFRPISGIQLHDLIDDPVPTEPMDLGEVMRLWGEHILHYGRRNGHARFFAYVATSADPIGMFADAMASAMNQTVTAWRSAPTATTVERIVMRWLDHLVGFGGNGGGLLLGGGSSANFHALACAVTQAELTAKLPSGSRQRLTMYMSTEAHVSMRKAATTLGLAEEHVRGIETDKDRRLDPDALQRAIQRDLQSELVPTAVCGSAGTANAGTIDPLEEVGTICRDFGIWFHIDGSYGAPAALTEDYAWMKAGFELADSLSLDPHKWLFAPCDAGALLIRDEQHLRDAFSEYSEYTAVSQQDPIERYAFFDHSLEMSRRFRALKVWSILKARGLRGIGEVIQRNIDLRRYLERRIEAHHQLEHLSGDLSICCFRFTDSSLSNGQVDALNARIVGALVAGGKTYMSPTTLEGRYALRVCIVNFRTTQADIDLLVDEVVQIGRQFLGE